MESGTEIKSTSDRIAVCMRDQQRCLMVAFYHFSIDFSQNYPKLCQCIYVPLYVVRHQSKQNDAKPYIQR